MAVRQATDKDKQKKDEQEVKQDNWKKSIKTK